MKKNHLLTTISVVGALIISGCTSMDYEAPEAYPTLTKEQIQQNVQEVFGTTFSPDQDWSSTTQRTVSVTADADLDDIVKVQILTESPFMNPGARVLSEAVATKGQTVTLSYDCPDQYSRIFAACVSSQGIYYAKGFNVGQQSVSYATAQTRGAEELRAANNFPEFKYLGLPMSISCLTYNGIRTIKANEGVTIFIDGSKNNDIGPWKNAGWENEREWRVADNSSANTGTWYIDAQTVQRQVSSISDSQKEELEDIFRTYLWRTDNTQKWSRQDNMEVIRNNAMFQWNNYLVSKGEPITITPVQMASSEIKNCNILYYYYNPDDIAGMTSAQEVQFLKNLPKFKLLSCYHTEVAQGINANSGSDEFFKIHENLLMYYGDNLLEGSETLSGFTTDNKLYRIRNGQKLNGEDYYIIYNTDVNNRLDVIYDDNDDNVANQLWQVFRNDNNECYLYNVGTQSFLYYDLSWNTFYTPLDYIGTDVSPFVLDGDNHILRNNSTTTGLGSDLGAQSNKGIWSNKESNLGERAKWYFEEYQGTKKFSLKSEVKKVNSYTVEAKDYAIPAGYRVGFVLRKRSQNSEDCYSKYLKKSWGHENNGELYGDGRLNTLINQFGTHFASGNDYYTMKADDPRIAIFTANNRIYMTFEDGSDAQFSDMIVEVNGAEAAPQTQTVDNNVYTLCFEDRQDGDYDMNDVVIKAKRIAKNKILYSLEACGAHDSLYLRNINGKVLNEYIEIHKMFNVSQRTFVNTESGKHIAPIQEEITVPDDFTFTDLENMVYIYNATTGKEVRLSKVGEDPHAILIPYDYQYPLEQVCIKDANTKFLEWGKAPSEDNSDWYVNGVEGKVYTESKLSE